MEDKYNAGKCPICGGYAVGVYRRKNSPFYCENKHAWDAPSVVELQDKIKELTKKLKGNTLKEMTLEEFADEHRLVLIVYERANPNPHHFKYYAEFDKVEVKKGSFLDGAVGNGYTPEEAIVDYCKKISSTKIVFNAYGEDRREIDVPRIHTNRTNKK